MFRSLWRRPTHAILIVSENPSGPLFQSEFLSQSELGLLTAFPDLEAVEIARRERPKLIIEDVDGQAGLAFCRDLAGDAATRSIPLILISLPDLSDRARETHACTVLEKPLAQGELFDAVRRHVPLPSRRTKRARINLRFTFRIGDRTAQAFSRDLSAAGAFLKTDRAIRLGTRLDLSFSVPGVVDEIRCASVVRGTSSTLAGGEPGGIGVEFEGMEESDRALLQRFIDQLRSG